MAILENLLKTRMEIQKLLKSKQGTKAAFAQWMLQQEKQIMFLKLKNLGFTL